MYVCVFFLLFLFFFLFTTENNHIVFFFNLALVKRVDSTQRWDVSSVTLSYMAWEEPSDTQIIDYASQGGYVQLVPSSSSVLYTMYVYYVCILCMYIMYVYYVCSL